MTNLEYTLVSLHFDFTQPGSWRERAANPEEREAWDRAQRKALGWRAGLSVWKRTNIPKSRILISRHWPHRLCWSWSIWVGLHRKGYDGHRNFRLHINRQYRFAEVKFFGPYVRLKWQGYDHMVARAYRDTAPRIVWKREVEAAMVEAAEATLQ